MSIARHALSGAKGTSCTSATLNTRKHVYRAKNIRQTGGPEAATVICYIDGSEPPATRRRNQLQPNATPRRLSGTITADTVVAPFRPRRSTARCVLTYDIDVLLGMECGFAFGTYAVPKSVSAEEPPALTV